MAIGTTTTEPIKTEPNQSGPIETKTIETKTIETKPIDAEGNVETPIIDIVPIEIPRNEFEGDQIRKLGSASNGLGSSVGAVQKKKKNKKRKKDKNKRY